MLALTAAAPVFRGYLVDSDSRWNVLRTSLDSRTSAELGEVPLKENQFRISKSRCDSIDSYLSPDGEKYEYIFSNAEFLSTSEFLSHNFSDTMTYL